MKQLLLAVLLRIILLTGILYSAARGEWNVVAMYTPVFLITLPLLLPKDRQYHWLDAGITIIFLAALIITFTIGWPDHYTFLTHDKLLHAAGGAWLTAFAAVLLRGRINDMLAFSISIIAVAVAIGAFWEVFEWVLSILPEPFYSPSTGHVDSMLDLIADTFGAGIMAILLYIRRYGFS